MKATEKQKQSMKEYQQKPDIKSKRRIYMKEYYKKQKQDPGFKEKERKRKKEYYIKNKEKIDERNKAWMKKNKKKFRKYLDKYYKKEENRLRRKEISKKWYENINKEKYRKDKRKWENAKVANDINFKMKKNLRLRVIQALKKYSETGKIRKSKDYEIDYEKIIEKLMKELPTDFNNKVYEIDHIEPCCSFDLTNEEQIKLCFAPENHQWLEKEKHKEKSKLDLKKSRKINDGI